MPELLIVVDEQDNPLYPEEKMKVHRLGLLHRAFSIFVFSNDMKKLLLQKRNRNKYHSGGLWANTTCGHPYWGEPLEKAVHRRLIQEMGFDTELYEIFVFPYKADVGNGLIENEIDHIFMGTYEGEIKPNPDEVEDYKWFDLEELKEDLKQRQHLYAVWFKLIFPEVLNWLKINVQQ